MAVLNNLTISGVIVDLILFFVIAGNAVLGYRKGLTRLLFSIFSGLIAIVLVFVLYKPTTNFIINNTGAKQKLENFFEEKLEYLFEKEDTEDIEQSDEYNSILKVFVGDQIGDLVEKTTDSITQYLSVQISHKVIGILCFFALFAIIRILLYIIRKYVVFVAELPVIRIVNSAGGMIYGILKGFLIIYTIFAIISFIVPIMQNTVINSAIQEALIGSKMFNNNIILNLIFKFLN